MYLVVVGNEIVLWAKTFKQAVREADRYYCLKDRIPVWIAKAIVKDGTIIDK